MEILKVFKFFSLAIAMLGMLYIGPDSRLKGLPKCDGGSMVVIIENWDKIIRVSSKDSECSILHIKISSGSNTAEYDGCFGYTCDIKANQLASGTYTVIVYTNNGYFSGEIYVP